MAGPCPFCPANPVVWDFTLTLFPRGTLLARLCRCRHRLRWRRLRPWSCSPGLRPRLRTRCYSLLPGLLCLRPWCYSLALMLRLRTRCYSLLPGLLCLRPWCYSLALMLRLRTRCYSLLPGLLCLRPWRHGSALRLLARSRASGLCKPLRLVLLRRPARLFLCGRRRRGRPCHCAPAALLRGPLRTCHLRSLLRRDRSSSSLNRAWVDRFVTYCGTGNPCSL